MSPLLATDERKRLDYALDTWQKWPINLVGPPKLVKPLNKGTTNNSYLVEVRSPRSLKRSACGLAVERFGVRINSNQSKELGIDRDWELELLRALAPLNISPKLLHDDRNLNFCVFSYVEGRVWSRHDLTRLSQRERLKEVVNRIQHIRVEASRFNYLKHLTGYALELEKRHIQLAKEKQLAFNEFLQQLEEFMEGSWQPVLCHHDLIPENILETDNGLFLLDWEYSGLGHPEFDLRYLGYCFNANIDESAGFLLKGDIIDKLIYWLVTLWQKLNEKSESTSSRLI
ncbi:phosphotransferase [Teredinibacter haidensis]|uniref:phosphotransferase n=1 Tax=Teredinibacter haidensis TaxID=2731755 RepID=UPI000948C50C|nr:phosphotransferase [Teredinibacter haidensis]